MNILDEIAEGYTYSGVVSLKAMEDDIVTIENQLDSLNSVLREIRLRGKNDKPVMQRIRDEKVKLSLLKAAFKRESENQAPYEAIMDVLGVTRDDTASSDQPVTAASGKEPLKQNFEKADIEVEELEDDEPSVELQSEKKEYEAPTTTVLEKEPDEVADEPVLVQPRDFEDCWALSSGTEEQRRFYLEQMGLVKKDKPVVEEHAVEEKEGDAVETEEETMKDVSLSETEAEVDEEPTEEVPLEAESDEVEERSYDVECDAPDEDATVIYSGTTSVPETEEKDAYAWVDVEEDEGGDEPVYDEPFDDDPGNVPGVVELGKETPYQKGTYTSCDLSSYCDMVNTESVTAEYNTDKKLVCMRFSDPRDYEVFLYLLKERSDRMRFFKKRKPIFIRVRAELEYKVVSYEIGFYGCRVVNVLDNTAIGPFGEEKHFCEAVFKYRNLKIKQTTLFAGPISSNGTTDTEIKTEGEGTKKENSTK